MAEKINTTQFEEANVNPFNAPTPGESLTTAPDMQKQWEKPPVYVEDADGDDGVDRARPHDGGDHYGQQQGGEGEDQVVAAHDQFVDPAAARRCGHRWRRIHLLALRRAADHLTWHRRLRPSGAQGGRGSCRAVAVATATDGTPAPPRPPPPRPPRPRSAASRRRGCTRELVVCAQLLV